MITALYAALSALLLVKLAREVISERRSAQVALGDGNNPQLLAAIRIHANAAEYIPIALLLMLLLEFNQAPNWLIHLSGIVLLISRLLHRSALQQQNIPRRVLSMRLTLNLLIGLAVANLVYLPFDQLLRLS
jgi:uncharacterized membrane protein YecN with MAPEG domain